MTKKTEQLPSDRLTLLQSRLKVAKSFSKKPHEAWKAWIDEYNIKDFDDTSEIRDRVRVGYVFRKTESELPAIFDDQPELFFKGRGKKLKDLEPQFESAYDYLWDIQNLDEKLEDAGLYFELLGMGFIKSPWVTKTRKVSEPILDPMTGAQVVDEKGQPAFQTFDVPIVDNPQATAPNPFKLHFSPETQFNCVLDYEHCPYLIDESAVMTTEEVKAKFGKDVEAGEILKLEDVDKEGFDKDNEGAKDDLKRVTVNEYYGCLPKEHAPKSSDWEYDKDYHIYFTDNEELKVEESPYEVKPYFIVGNYGLSNRFWRFGDAKHLMPLIQEYQAYRTQILKHTRKMANPKPLLPTEGNIDEVAFRNPKEGEPVKYSGAFPPSYLNPPNLGSEVQVGVEMVQRDLEKQSGTFDLASGNGQSTIKTPRGIQVFSEAADKNIRRKRKKIARLIRQIIIFQFKQLATNWTAQDNKTLTVGGEERPVDDQVLAVFGDEQLLSRLDIEVESLSINRVQMKQDALDLLELSLKSEQSFPGLINLQEMWKDVLQNGYGKKDADRYLASLQQIQQQGIQQFLAQLGQINPELAAQVVQTVQQPNLSAMQQQGGQQSNLATMQQQPNEPTSQPQQQPAV